jgi:hypothetical protein
MPEPESTRTAQGRVTVAGRTGPEILLLPNRPHTTQNISNVVGWQSAGWAFDDTKHFGSVLH